MLTKNEIIIAVGVGASILISIVIFAIVLFSGSKTVEMNEANVTISNEFLDKIAFLKLGTYGR